MLPKSKFHFCISLGLHFDFILLVPFLDDGIVDFDFNLISVWEFPITAKAPIHVDVPDVAVNGCNRLADEVHSKPKSWLIA